MVRLDANPPQLISKNTPEKIKLPTNLYSDEPPLETDFFNK
jgi:hypothetical protein